MAGNKIKTDLWGKLQAISTLILGVAGLWFTAVHQNVQEQNRKWQAATQILSSREVSEMEFRQRMFGTVLNSLWKGDLPIDHRIALLRFFEYNFHDVFYGRAHKDTQKLRKLLKCMSRRHET